MTSIVSIRELSKIYGAGETEVRALDKVSLDIESGEFLALMGPSGSGKSTLLHIIAGIDRPTEGECQVQGVDVAQLNESELADWRNQNVGFIFQTFNLIPVLSCAQLLQAIDFALNRGAFPIEPEPLQCPDTFVDERRGGSWFGGDVRHQLGIHCT